MRALNTVLNEDIMSGLAPTRRVLRLLPHRQFVLRNVLNDAQCSDGNA